MPPRRNPKRQSKSNDSRQQKIPKMTPSTSKKSSISLEDDEDLPPVPLNPHCRQLLVGYMLKKTDGVFDQMYVDTENNSYLVPETPMIDFQRLFLMNKYFNHAVRSYFQYLHYHYSITSRWGDELEFHGTSRMFNESLDRLPSIGLPSRYNANHQSIVVFKNGPIYHVFKARNFLKLRAQGLFRERAQSLSFYGSDTSQIPMDKGLFTDLKSLNFQVSEDLSGKFSQLLNDSFTSLKHLTFYHRHFIGKLNDQVVFPPNLQYLHSSSTSISVMSCDLEYYKHLLQVDTKELTIGIELINKWARLNEEPILLNPKIESLTLHWTSEVNEDHAAKLIKLFPNHSLKKICLKKRELKDLYGGWYSLVDPQKHQQKPIKSIVQDIDVKEISVYLDQMCRQNGISMSNFPFEVIFEFGLFVFYRRQGKREPFSEHPISIQFVFQNPKCVKFRLLQNHEPLSDGQQLRIDDSVDQNDLNQQIFTAMVDFWPKLGLQHRKELLNGPGRSNSKKGKNK